MPSTDNIRYTDTTSSNLNLSYAPYFIVSLHDHTVREGEPILFEVVVSGIIILIKNSFFFTIFLHYYL